MVIIKFDNEGLINSYIYEVENVELNNNTILFNDNNYNIITEMNRNDEIQFLFNKEDFQFIEDNIDLSLHFVKYDRVFTPPFETNVEKIKRLETKNTALKEELSVTQRALDDLLMSLL